MMAVVIWMGQVGKHSLMTPEEFLKLPQGKAVTISPGYSNKKEAYIPILHDIKVSQVDIENSKRSVGHWDKLLSKIQSSKRQLSNAEYAEIMTERRAIVERLFPEPPQGKLLAKLTTLVNVVLYPDAGCFDKWTKKSIQIKSQIFCNIKTSSLTEKHATKDQTKAGYDIADYIIEGF